MACRPVRSISPRLSLPGRTTNRTSLGWESLTVAGRVAEQETGQLCLGVERPMPGETVVEDHDVVHAALLLLDGGWACGSGRWDLRGDGDVVVGVEAA